jgi:hypothetical protein
MRLVPVDRRTGRTSQLRCDDCGLIYSWAAVAREITLATGIACRRCGGTLEPSDDPRLERNPVVAVRSAVKRSMLATRAP